MDFKYIALFFTMIFLGAEAEMGAGALSHFGFLNFWSAFILITLGIYVSDIVFYYLGKKFGEKFARKFGKFVFLSTDRFDRIKKVFLEKGGLIIFLSKLIYCAGHLTSAMAGATGMKFKRFFMHQLYSSAFASILFMSLGYFFSSFIDSITRDIKIISLGIVIFLILFVLGEKFLTKVFRHKF